MSLIASELKVEKPSRWEALYTGASSSNIRFWSAAPPRTKKPGCCLHRPIWYRAATGWFSIHLFNQQHGIFLFPGWWVFQDPSGGLVETATAASSCYCYFFQAGAFPVPMQCSVLRLIRITSNVLRQVLPRLSPVHSYPLANVSEKKPHSLLRWFLCANLILFNSK